MIRLLFALSFLGTTVSAALAEEIVGPRIPETIANKTVTLLTMGFKFPLYYGSNGSVTGDGSAVGLSKYFSPKETGKWWVENDLLCQKFPTWYDGKTFCFSLVNAGPNRLTWKRDDGFSGKAIVSG